MGAGKDAAEWQAADWLPVYVGDDDKGEPLFEFLVERVGEREWRIKLEDFERVYEALVSRVDSGRNEKSSKRYKFLWLLDASRPLESGDDEDPYGYFYNPSDIRPFMLYEKGLEYMQNASSSSE